METNVDWLKNNRFLFFCLLAVGFAVVVSNLAGNQAATITTDLLYLPASGGLLVLSIVIAVRFRVSGETGKAYLLFVGFVSSWFAGEVVWLRAELIYHLVPFPQETDWLYLLGYPFLLGFMIYYLKPFRTSISKKMIFNATLATTVFLVPTLYAMYSFNPTASLIAIVWAALYPLSDAVVLFPAVLGLNLFLKGQVSLLWSLCCIAIILNIIADSGFLFLSTDNSVNSGNPANILYLWAYILFAFGIYSHVKLFSMPKKKSFGKVDDLK
jgi:hypothetical protein